MQYIYKVIFQAVDEETGTLEKDFSVSINVQSDLVSADCLQEGIAEIHENVHKIIQDSVS